MSSSANDSGVFSNSSSTLVSSNANFSDASSFQGHNRALSPKSPKSPVPANVSIVLCVLVYFTILDCGLN